jgi:hypothetical protein
MKKKATLAVIILCLLSFNASSQALKKFFGISLSYSHDNLTNNRLLSNYYPLSKNNSDVFEISGEFGIIKSSKKAIAFDFGYQLNQSIQEIPGSYMQAADFSKSMITGIVFGPKYRVMKEISDKISFYSDFVIHVNYLMHRNTVTKSDPVTDFSQRMNMNGNEFKYGTAVVPGFVFYPTNHIGIKIEKTLFEIYHSTINESNNTDINFKPISSWDYNFIMKAQELKLGLIIKI